MAPYPQQPLLHLYRCNIFLFTWGKKNFWPPDNGFISTMVSELYLQDGHCRDVQLYIRVNCHGNDLSGQTKFDWYSRGFGRAFIMGWAPIKLTIEYNFAQLVWPSKCSCKEVLISSCPPSKNINETPALLTVTCRSKVNNRDRTFLLYNIQIHILFWKDLKDPQRKDDMAAARATLKESSKMLLSSSKVNFKKIVMNKNVHVMIIYCHLFSTFVWCN